GGACLGVADIGGPHGDRPAREALRLLQPVAVDVDRQDRGALGGEAGGDGPTDAGPCTGDERDLAGESFAHDAGAQLVAAVSGLANHRFSSTSFSLFQPSAVRTTSWW